MTLKNSALLKWLTLPLILIAVFVGIRVFSGPKTTSNSASASRPARALSTDEAKSLGIEADTPKDTLATLVAQLRQLRQELKTAVNDNKDVKAENARLRARENAADERLRATLDQERERQKNEQAQLSKAQERTQSELQTLQKRLNGAKSTRGRVELPEGLGLDGMDEDVDTTRPPVRWIEPDDRPGSKAAGGADSKQAVSQVTFTAPSSFASESDSARLGDAESARGSTRSATESRDSRAVYTVPANSTLLDSVAMTALIGRVPVDGAVNDPYPFKLLVGAENLAANGIDIPGIEGAVASGSASGDWTLSCVRGEIRSLTFVFQDGTIRTVTSSSAGGSDSTSRSGIGWVSDSHGIPCVAGESRSNAKQYFTAQMLVTAAGAGAASAIPRGNSSYSYVTGGSGSSLGTVGISGSEAMGRILGSGVQDATSWVNKLYGQAFAAIYVRPGAEVAIHIEQPLRIDYDPRGRKVTTNDGRINDTSLD